MRRISKGTNSCKRERPADGAVKGIHTSGRNMKDTDTADEAKKDSDTTDKTAEMQHTSDKSVTAKDTINNGTGIQGTAAGDATAGTGDNYSPETHIRDANSRTIFRNRKLTCQFLRDYTGLSIFENLQPEDIEDVTEHYQAFLGIRFETDTVKKVRIRGGDGERDVFVLPLVEHKTDVDYDVAMQLLRYMAVIWYDYKRQQEKLKEGSTRLKGFCYPPIIPVVYYEGKECWTAGLRLSDRIGMRDTLKEYIPDFRYKLVRVHGYGNDDLKEKENEMSLVMMINRIQSPEDFAELIHTSKEYVDRIYSRSTADIREVYQDILWGLFRKMNVPVEEARDKLARLEEGGMGYLFASMEKMDIQAERRNTQLARQELEEANRRLKESNQRLEESNQRLEESNQRLEESNQRLEESNQRLEESDRRMDTFFSHLVSICQGGGMTREETLVCLQERYGLSEAEAASAVEQNWQHR